MGLGHAGESRRAHRGRRGSHLEPAVLAATRRVEHGGEPGHRAALLGHAGRFGVRSPDQGLRDIRTHRARREKLMAYRDKAGEVRGHVNERWVDATEDEPEYVELTLVDVKQ